MLPALCCVVIGAGLVGLCVALRLAQAGATVTLLERDKPGGGATRSSFAWLNANNKTPRAYFDLNHEGMLAWAGLAAEAGQPAWYRASGNLEWARDARGHAELAARVRRLTEWGYPAGFLGAASAAELEPALQPSAATAEVAWFPGESYLLTEPAVGYLAAAAADAGVRVLTGEAGRVTGFGPPAGLDRAGRKVHTADGGVIAADAVVCCAGHQVPELARLAGATIPVPLVPWETPGAEAPGLVVHAGPVSGVTRMVHAPAVHLRPHRGGLIHLEAPDAPVDLHTPAAELRRWADELLRRARRVIRGLDGAEVTGYRVCVRPMPSDGQSIVGWLPGAPGVYVAVTHSGVTLGAHLGQLIAAEIAGGQAQLELAPFRPDRFAPALLLAPRSLGWPPPVPSPPPARPGVRAGCETVRGWRTTRPSTGRPGTSVSRLISPLPTTRSAGSPKIPASSATSSGSTCPGSVTSAGCAAPTCSATSAPTRSRWPAWARP